MIWIGMIQFCHDPDPRDTVCHDIDCNDTDCYDTDCYDTDPRDAVLS